MVVTDTLAPGLVPSLIGPVAFNQPTIVDMMEAFALLFCDTVVRLITHSLPYPFMTSFFLVYFHILEVAADARGETPAN